MPARSSRFTRVLELVELPCEGKLRVADLGLGVPREEGMFVEVEICGGGCVVS